MQGGAMRGLFTAGVMDVLMENGIDFDGAIGVSAGAVFGVNFKSKQIDRVHRYISKYASDYRFGSLKSWIKSGNIYDVKFCYYDLPFVLDKFDTETFTNNPMEFYVGCSDVETGLPVYQKLYDGGQRDLKYMLASASMPIVSKIVEVDGKKLLDGGVTDSVPIKFFESLGYDKNLIVLTRPIDYIDEPDKVNFLMPLLYPKKFADAARTHHEVFNKTIEYINEGEKEGKYVVIRPEFPLPVGSIEKDISKLEEVYQHGRMVASKKLEEIKNYFNEK